MSTRAAAVEITLWPLVYSGNGGVCSSGVQASSTNWLMTVSGRTTPVEYLASQLLMKPSASATLVRAYTAAASPFMREVREVHAVSRALTPEQREITAFWDCNPYVMNVTGHTMFASKKITPGGHWMGITATAARKADADVLRTAEAYARTSVALADGFVSSWDEKYRSGVVRPETVINTYLDEQWTPLLQTPPFPEYTSGHSVISTAAAVVLTDLFGRDFAYTDSTEARYGLPVRSFRSFEQAAAEAAISRLYGGIHYRHSIEEGQKQGRKVGELVVARVRTRAERALAAAPAGPPAGRR